MGVAAGIILILISIAHNIYGEKKQIPELKAISSDPIMIGALRIMIYQGGILLFVTGIIQVLSSVHFIELPGISAYFPLGVVLLNFLTSLIIILLIHREVLKITIPQFVIFTIIIVLQYLSLD